VEFVWARCFVRIKFFDFLKGFLVNNSIFFKYLIFYCIEISEIFRKFYFK